MLIFLYRPKWVQTQSKTNKTTLSIVKSCSVDFDPVWCLFVQSSQSEAKSQASLKPLAHKHHRSCFLSCWTTELHILRGEVGELLYNCTPSSECFLPDTHLSKSCTLPPLQGSPRPHLPVEQEWFDLILLKWSFIIYVIKLETDKEGSMLTRSFILVNSGVNVYFEKADLSCRLIYSHAT